MSRFDAGTHGNAGVGWRGSDAGLGRCGVQRCPERWRSEGSCPEGRVGGEEGQLRGQEALRPAQVEVGTSRAPMARSPRKVRSSLCRGHIPTKWSRVKGRLLGDPAAK